MPPATKRRSGIPRPSGPIPRPSGPKPLNSNTGPSGTETRSRTLRKSSSSDPDWEYTATAEEARTKVSKPLKMQGPFRPSIVGRMAKSSDWVFNRGRKMKNKPVKSSDQATSQISHRRKSEEEKQIHNRSSKSKSRSPTERRAAGNQKDTKHIHDVQPKVHTERNKVTHITAQHLLQEKETRHNLTALKEENRVLHRKVDSLQLDISACKKALEKCHIDPVTLEPMQFNEKDLNHEKTLATMEVENTKTAMQNILDQNKEMMDSLKDLLKGLS